MRDARFLRRDAAIGATHAGLPLSFNYEISLQPTKILRKQL
jgi:hypothetical protein